MNSYGASTLVHTIMADLRRPLRRSRDDRMIAGVLAGLADYLGIDHTLTRAGFVILSIVSAGFPGALVYILLWLIIPEEP